MKGLRDRVLVYDDDEHLRTAACALLRSAGFDAIDCPDEGTFLVRLAREGAVAAIIDFDIGVGYRDRIDIGRFLREDRRFAGLVLIGVSSDVGWIDLDLVDFALSKPYVTAELPQLVRGMIEITRSCDDWAQQGKAVGGWRASHS